MKDARVEEPFHDPKRGDDDLSIHLIASASQGVGHAQLVFPRDVQNNQGPLDIPIYSSNYSEARKKEPQCLVNPGLPGMRCISAQNLDF